MLADVVAAGTPAVRRTVFRYADGEVADVTIRPRAGVDALYAPRRHLLDRLLVEAAERGRRAGAARDGRDLAAPRRHGPGGRRRRADPQPASASSLAAGLTIGARRDPVPRRGTGRCRDHVAGADVERGALPLRGGPAGDGYEWTYGDGAGSGVIPTNDGASCVFVGTTPAGCAACAASASSGPSPSCWSRRVPPLRSGRAALRPVAPVRGWAGLPGFARESAGPGWALVGDAGYFKDPITSHGITDALRDAELLAGQVLASRAGAVPEQRRWRATRRPATGSRATSSR